VLQGSDDSGGVQFQTGPHVDFRLPERPREKTFFSVTRLCMHLCASSDRLSQRYCQFVLSIRAISHGAEEDDNSLGSVKRASR
jgi:hypothetical protein